MNSEKCKVKSRWAGSAYLFFGGEKTSRNGGLAASFSQKSALPALFFLLEETSEGGDFQFGGWSIILHKTSRNGGLAASFSQKSASPALFFLLRKTLERGRFVSGGRWDESGSAVRMATQRTASAIGVRCIGHRTALRFWRQTDASWCAVPFNSGLTAEQGCCREGKRTRSSLSLTEVETLHPHISHLIPAEGIAPSHLSYPMQTAEERQWTRGRSSAACKTQRTAFTGAAFCVMHRSTARLRMRYAVRGPED